MNLVKLAAQKKLPKHQFMDEETLFWIGENRPEFTCKPDKEFLSIIIKDVLRYFPDKRWFLSEKVINSIHGIRHLSRVVANTSYLIQENSIDDKSLTIKTLIAASLHDIGRKDDRADDNHAKRSARWFLKNKKEVFSRYKIKLSENDSADIAKIISGHETLNFLEDKNVGVNLLKSADALDRYRLPRIKWWINESYLSLIPSERAKIFAFNAVFESEKLFLNTKNSKYSIIKTLRNLRCLK